MTILVVEPDPSAVAALRESGLSAEDLRGLAAKGSVAAASRLVQRDRRLAVIRRVWPRVRGGDSA